MGIAEPYKSILSIVGLLAIIAIVCLGVLYVTSNFTINPVSQSVDTTSVPVVTQSPTPASVQTPAVVTTIPMDFEVDSTTTATGHYQVLTGADIILFCPNIQMWETIYPGNWYHADVAANGDGTYNIVDISLTVYGYNGDIQYYYDGNVYYADYSGYAHPIPYTEVRGKVIFRAPPHPIYRQEVRQESNYRHTEVINRHPR